MHKSTKSPRSKALYAQVLDELRERILSGNLTAGTRLPTEQEIARQHQISRGTVRQALSILVNEGLLERIQGSGTYVRQSPPTYRQSSSPENQEPPPIQKNIGLILSQVGDELNMDILLGVEQAAKPRGYQISFAFSEESAEALASDITRLRASTAGLIIFPISNLAHDSAIAQLARDRFPFVLVDRYISDLACDYVVSDNRGGGYSATEHLLILGHKRIGFVYSRHGSLLTTSVRDRWEGYSRALKKNDIPYDESLIYHIQDDSSEPPNAFDEIMTSKGRPDAFFAVNDSVALRLLQAAQRHHLRVPEDVALVGFDDVSYAAHVSIPLTTVAQQRTEMGMRAGTLLINRIEGQVIGTPKQIELPTNLIIRQSCGARLHIASTSPEGRA